MAGTDGSRTGGTNEILIEFVVQGGFVKVTAIHSATGTEATVVGPASAPRAALEAAAARKLNYVIGKAGKGSAAVRPS